MRLLLVLLCLSCDLASAELKYGFGNINFNHLNWTEGTERKSTKRDFQYLEVEGFGEYTWGDLYGFFDYENVGKKGNEVRTAMKGAVNHFVGLGRLTVYGHVYNFAADGFFEQNRVLGLGYMFGGEGWWFKPWLGFHDVSQSFYSGPNGYMAGWTVGYIFKIQKQQIMLADWHEFEFDRDERYARGQGGSREAHNGAVSVWWNTPWKVSAGVQGRYATSKLGTPGSLGAVIYTIKHFF